MPPRATSSDDLNAMIERVTPDVLALLADGVPRDEAAIVAALEGRHSKHDVRLTLMRLDVLGQLEMRGGRYVLAEHLKHDVRTTRAGAEHGQPDQG